VNAVCPPVSRSRGRSVAEEQESGNQHRCLYGPVAAAIFLALAAACMKAGRSPFAVMPRRCDLVIPWDVDGCVSGGFENGVFFQVGLLTVVGS